MGFTLLSGGQAWVVVSKQIKNPQNGDNAPAVVVPCKVMVVDESEPQRQFLAEHLLAAGYEVVEAATADEALSTFRASSPDLVISDWVMTGMTGLDLCRWLRDMQLDSYVYFILLTSKSESTDVAAALDAGADDFLIKPITPAELRGRTAAGRRILLMERELRRKNRLLLTTIDELHGLHEAFNRDLIEARKLQQSLVRDRHRFFGRSEISLLLQPSGHVGGDLVGFFPIDGSRVGCFALDVSGHGIASAMMTARLAGYLSGSSPEQNIALIPSGEGRYNARNPAELAQILNKIVLSDMQTENYFTFVYADIDVRSGWVEMLQAGHPHPAILRVDGSVELLGTGGLPIGLIEGASFDTFQAKLEVGDRLLLVSDGVTDTLDYGGRASDETKLTDLLGDVRHLGGTEFLDALYLKLKATIDGDARDDISAVCFCFDGPTMRAIS